MSKTNIYIYLTIACILLIVIIVLAFLIFRENDQSLQPGTVDVTPTPVSNTHSPEELRQETQPLEGEDFDEFIQSVQNRSQLSERDTLIRNELIAQGEGLNKRDLYNTPEFILRYVPTADVFHVEILGENINQVRSSALAYLRSLGLSDEGICNLPVVFYKDPKRNNPELTTGLFFYEFLDTCPDGE